jgi:hypothetical protein
MRSHSRVKKRVRMAAVSERHGTRTPSTGCFRCSLYKHLIVCLPSLYVFRRLLSARQFWRPNAHLPVAGRGLGEAAMQLTIPHYLFLIPVGLALAFMFWVLRSLTRQLSNNNEPSQKQPMISIRVGDRYSPGGSATRMRNPEKTSRTVGQFSPGSKRVSIASREITRLTYAPTLGMGGRRMSSRTNRDAQMR